LLFELLITANFQAVYLLRHGDENSIRLLILPPRTISLVGNWFFYVGKSVAAPNPQRVLVLTIKEFLE